jgi:EmrB/QacA subfamily drug resistance transporter
MAFLDTTAVNVALPTLERELGSGLAGLQWTVDAYLLTLSAFLLLGGSLGDLFGQRRMFVLGVVSFALSSAACGLMSSILGLSLARALQGVGAAILVPGSLAVLRTSIAEDQGAAIGAWAGLSGVTTAAGPLLGGWLVQSVSWRAIFFLNLPLGAVAVWAALRFLSSTPGRGGVRLDVPGATAAAVGIGGVTFALIEGPAQGWDFPVLVVAALGVLALVVFVPLERRPAPMLPLTLFASRTFSAANLTTLAVYAGLGGAMFLLAITLQQACGYTPLASGAALLPLTLLLLVLSPLAGRLAQRFGARLPLSVGPAVVALGLLLFVRVRIEGNYLPDVLPGVRPWAGHHRRSPYRGCPLRRGHLLCGNCFWGEQRCCATGRSFGRRGGALGGRAEWPQRSPRARGPRVRLPPGDGAERRLGTRRRRGGGVGDSSSS